MDRPKLPHVDTSSFDAEVLRAAGPVVVDFSATWCPPCRMMEPVLTGLAAEMADRVTVRELDVDENPDIRTRYGVLSMPTLMLFVDGEPVDRTVGFSGAGSVRRWIEDGLRTIAGAVSS
ncbi:MAG TPA: thioredoxin [Candidatus Dormibacteraeota bacterium]|jgi:thioredoxin 1|nr:thioredoxin [Candidatus Dormibacteraeota bacterium]